VTLTAPGSLETWIVADLRLSHGLAGLTQSAFFAGNLLGSFAAGWLLRAWPPRRVGVASLALLAAGNLLSAAGGYRALLLGRLLAGLGVSTAVVFGSTVLVRGFPARQAALLNALHACIAGGAAVALGGARRLGQALGSWRAALGSLALPALVSLALVAAAALPDVAADGEDGARARGLLRPALLAVLLLMGGYMIAEQGFTTFFAAYAQEEGRLPGGFPALLAGLFWIGLGAGRLLSAAASSRLAEGGQLVGCALLGLALLAGTTFLSGPLPVAAGTTAAGIALGPVIPLGFSRAARQVDREAHKSVIVGLTNAAACTGGAVGPLAIGAVADAWSLRTALVAGYVGGLACAAPLLASLAGARSGGPSQRSRNSS
jgi:CP family cyanate transporter-like MFS transporter